MKKVVRNIFYTLHYYFYSFNIWFKSERTIHVVKNDRIYTYVFVADFRLIKFENGKI